MLIEAGDRSRTGGWGHRRLSLRTVALFGPLVGFNLGAWAWAFAAFHRHPVLLGAALLAWVFGLRHAVDADHIAAIDNVVRKLIQDGRRADTAGLWFSLGHSTVVVLASLAIAASAIGIQTWLGVARQIGGVAGTLVSAFFLMGIAIANLFVLRGVWRSFRLLRQGASLEASGLDEVLAGTGVLARLLRPLFRALTQSWQMYPLGFLFGLGFDTATEVGILGIAALEAGKGLPVYTIMVFPLLFTVGMCLLDTTDGVLMLGCYGWAFVKPIRKLYYNFNITLVSVLVAVLVGTVEALSIIGPQLGYKGTVWDTVARMSDNFGLIGAGIIGIFVASWFVSTAIYKLRRYDELEPVTPIP
jgi:high-affinity nickel-transport protein